MTKHEDWVRKTYLSGTPPFEQHDLWENEFKALTMCMVKPHIQQVIDGDMKATSITSRYCGEPLGPGTEVKNPDKQIKSMLGSLKRAGILHRDIRPGNIMVMDGIMTLIDFEWAVFKGSIMEKREACGSLGMKWRKGKTEFDDEYSLRMSLEVRS